MRKTLLLGAWAAGALVLLQSPARAVDGEALKRSVDAGVAYLKQTQQANGTWGGGVAGGIGGDHTVGATALAAMTLLECGVPANDDAIKKAADYVRNASVNETGTYQISLAILFLDKLRDPVDVALIESLTVRLMAGQNAQGAWSYTCPQIADSEVKRLLGLLQNRNELVGKREVPKDDDPKRTLKDLPKEIQAQLNLIQRGLAGPAGGPNKMVGGDNSNTQFATIALWVARRHGLPVEKTLANVSVHFRQTVAADGGWDYKTHLHGGPAVGNDGILPGGTSTATMTCAGLLGLTVAYGVNAEVLEERAKLQEKDGAKPKELPLPDMTKDTVLTRALGALSTTVGLPTDKIKALGRPAVIPRIAGRSYYFLWSLERVCVALDLDTIGGKDWYEWGAEVLLANQKQDGSWEGDYAHERADTCFALLFLKRANFTRDLSAKLKGRLDQKLLRGGGVGGDGLKDKLSGGLTKPGEDTGEKSGDNKEQKAAAEKTESLAKEAIQAKGEEQEKALAKLRDGAGRQYTDAMLIAISQLTADAKKGARKMLAERLAKEGKDSPDRLTDYLDDRDPEIRRAAELACALNDSKAHVQQLIGMLLDREPLVSRAAWAALKNLTKQDFGPALDATDADKEKAVKAWREWWAANNKK